jgi:hypothetical protein
MTMKKIALLFSLGFYLCAFAQEQMLVSVKEMNISNETPPRLEAKSIPEKDSPVLEVINPKVSSTVSSPTAVDIKFQASPQSSIKPETFKVLYGTFQLDITKRILSVAQVTPLGVSVEAAKLPAGRHKLTLTIEDTKGRTGVQMVEFEVK